MNLVFNEKNCSGCGVCKLACSMENFGQVRPSAALLRIEGLFPDPGKYRIHFCDQCGICADTCPADAIELENGIYRIIEDDCIFCHECVDACPKDVMTIDTQTNIPAKCILCGQCAYTCPRDAVTIVDQAPLKEVQ